MREIRTLLVLLLAIAVLGSCSKFRKIQKSGDWRVKYEAAIEYYKEEDYHRTIILLEDILPIIRGTEEAELGNFYLAYSYYYQKQYILVIELVTNLDRVPNYNALYFPFVACHLQYRSTLIYSVSLRYSYLLPISNSQSNVKKLTAVCSVNILVRNIIWIEVHY